MLEEIVQNYLKLFPGERDDLKLFLSQLANGDVMNNRKTLPGHATASALVLSPDKTKILMIHHKVFNDWYQPGGHWDPEDKFIWEAARREAKEETAVNIAEQVAVFDNDLRIPLRISSHLIPARPKKQEGEHYHHDLHYVFIAASEQLAHQEAEVTDARWFSFAAPECDHIRTDIARIQKFILA